MLRGIRHCSEAVEDFLDLVEKHMLVAVPDDRWPMDKVCTELARISKRCENDDAYWHWDKPRSNRNYGNFPPEFDDEEVYFYFTTRPAIC